MTELIYLALCLACIWAAYQLGVMDGEKREYKKWYARQWHRPGCDCDGDTQS